MGEALEIIGLNWDCLHSMLLCKELSQLSLCVCVLGNATNILVQYGLDNYFPWLYRHWGTTWMVCNVEQITVLLLIVMTCSRDIEMYGDWVLSIMLSTFTCSMWWGSTLTKTRVKDVHVKVVSNGPQKIFVSRFQQHILFKAADPCLRSQYTVSMHHTTDKVIMNVEVSILAF